MSRPGMLGRKLGEFAEIFVGTSRKPLQPEDIVLQRVSGYAKNVGRPVCYVETDGSYTMPLEVAKIHEKTIRTGKLGILPGNTIVVRFTPYGKQHVVPKYVYYMLESAWKKGHWLRYAHGTVQQFLRVDYVKDFPIGAIKRPGEMVAPPTRRPIKPYKTIEAPGFTALDPGWKRLARMQFEREYALHPEKRKTGGVYTLLEGKAWAEFHPRIRCPKCGYDVAYKWKDMPRGTRRCHRCKYVGQLSEFTLKEDVLEFMTVEEWKQKREPKERKLFYEITKGPLIPPGGIRKRVHLWKDFYMTKAEFWNQLPKKPPAGFTLEDLEEMWKMDVPDPAEYARRKGAR